MKIQFDPAADALYLQLAPDQVVDSETIEPDLVYDYDAENQVIGVEVLRVSVNLADLAVKPLPFSSLEQQVEFINFLESLADQDLQAKLAFAKQILQNQRALLQKA
ncbi:DUF2283 domain-containing protein [Nodosilinea sp. P-1105]|uniref:DUF2283 domain-containing protein n=1 Tax=Nodosilinea sp. P-1105 TaxID=2546229 RepID=UPI00146F1356|nr:DUF2283 domain-containing protein [Nodosilinea sp. P-1105]NMF82030.1 DUF2283 domain-containing protein [Nodosilinea sp. P-1105]